MLDTTTFLTVVIAVIIGVFVAILIYLQQKIGVATKAVDKDTKILKLQAYERLILFANRISIPHLISRLQQEGKSSSTLSSTDQQLLLVATIKEEFEHNVTQQLYVSKTTWDSITNYKEKNILLIHQAAATLPVGATAGELNRLLISFLANDPSGDMHQFVSELLSLEVKQIL
ncbi:MAG: hypothetical protein RL372_538 [Bacteroidota bacterium]|jgi:hypothetical protein